ncbi:hypothetical protein F5B20DRAFT_514332 [Whalleya microplaca]|nr:hypothetical protein F5B20DRAFT_514332 [Whalleya microplaca]
MAAARAQHEHELPTQAPLSSSRFPLHCPPPAPAPAPAPALAQHHHYLLPTCLLPVHHHHHQGSTEEATKGKEEKKKKKKKRETPQSQQHHQTRADARTTTQNAQNVSGRERRTLHLQLLQLPCTTHSHWPCTRSGRYWPSRSLSFYSLSLSSRSPPLACSARLVGNLSLVCFLLGAQSLFPTCTQPSKAKPNPVSSTQYPVPITHYPLPILPLSYSSFSLIPRPPLPLERLGHRLHSLGLLSASNPPT